MPLSFSSHWNVFHSAASISLRWFHRVLFWCSQWPQTALVTSVFDWKGTDGFRWMQIYFSSEIDRYAAFLIRHHRATISAVDCPNDRSSPFQSICWLDCGTSPWKNADRIRHTDQHIVPSGWKKTTSLLTVGREKRNYVDWISTERNFSQVCSLRSFSISSTVSSRLYASEMKRINLAQPVKTKQEKDRNGVDLDDSMLESRKLVIQVSSRRTSLK